jgi:hypothetical protein
MHIAFIAQPNPSTEAFITADQDHHQAKMPSKPT